MMDIEDLEQNGMVISIGRKTIRAKGCFIGNLFCVDRRNIENNLSLTEREKEELIRQLLSNKNILLSK